MTPAGRFTHVPDPAAERTYVAVAAGSGITPVLSIVAALLEGEPGVVRHPRLRQPHPPVGDVPRRGGRPQGHLRPAAAAAARAVARGDRGRPAVRPARRRAAHPDPRRPGAAGEVDAWFLCGPQQMVAELSGVLLAPASRARRCTPSCSTPSRSSGPPSPTSPRSPDGAAAVTVRLDGAVLGLLAASRRPLGPRGRAGGALRRAVRLQGRRLRHLPGPGRRGQRGDGRQLRPRARGDRGRLRAHLPVAPDQRRGWSSTTTPDQR